MITNTHTVENQKKKKTLSSYLKLKEEKVFWSYLIKKNEKDLIYFKITLHISFKVMVTLKYFPYYFLFLAILAFLKFSLIMLLTSMPLKNEMNINMLITSSN